MTETELKENETQTTVDFPQAGEVIKSPEYTVRLGSQEAKKVEVSIDEGPWQPCRFSVGYWWFDWSGYLPGRHDIRARVHTAEGPNPASMPRRFAVELDGKR